MIVSIGGMSMRRTASKTTNDRRARSGKASERRSFSLPRDLALRVSAIAERCNTTDDGVIRSLLLAAIEDAEDALLASERLKRLADGSAAIISSEEMWRSLGLEDKLDD